MLPGWSSNRTEPVVISAQHTSDWQPQWQATAGDRQLATQAKTPSNPSNPKQSGSFLAPAQALLGRAGVDWSLW